jgi:3-oxoacyl-[acyl-carrier protein] reductase
MTPPATPGNTVLGAVLITGAAKGLGRAMALHLAAPGRHLILHSRAPDGPSRAAAQAAGERGARVTLLHADLARAEERERLMDGVAAATGTLGALINNAGVYRPTALADITPAEWQEVFDATCGAVFHLTQRAVPLLKAGAPARVVNLGDSGADRIAARVQATHYHVAKLGVHALTRGFAKTLAPHGITVNQISPGFLENSVGAPGSPLPAGRLGTFADVLAALDYLLSPAAQYTSGANLIVSGGWNL